MGPNLVRYEPEPRNRFPAGQVGPAAAGTAELSEAQRLLDLGLPLEAQGVLQRAARSGAEAERALWEGLAKLASGVTQARRGNAAGAIALIRRGREELPEAEATPHGIDAPGLRAWSRRSIMALSASGGTASLAPLRLSTAEGPCDQRPADSAQAHR